VKIDPEDPRGHFERRSYSRAIVPGTLPDQKRHYTQSTVFRPDKLTFALWRRHERGVTSAWTASDVKLSGMRVLKGGNVTTTEGQNYSNSYDLEEGSYSHVAPAEVVEFVRAITDSANAEGS